MERAIQNVFRQHFAGYAASRKLSLREHEAAQRFVACRSAQLGGHVETCPEGHFRRIHYNSCKHRSCASCNALQTERWLRRQQARLLDCPHHHIIFTIAHELIPLWLFNRSAVMNLLFHAVNDTLKNFLGDPRYLGATPGALLAFHSWGRDLSIHPHIHCLITDGGLDAQGTWQRPKRIHFLPLRPLMLAFRGRFTALLHRGLDAGDLVAPGGSVPEWHGIIGKLKRKKWNVHLEQRYDHARGVAIYLARYVRGGPIRNDQVRLSQGQVQFAYRDHRLNKPGSRHRVSRQTWSTDQFLARYLQHVPEKRRQVVRCYGLYAHRSKERLNRARVLHHQAPLEEAVFLDWETFMYDVAGEDFRRCPECRRRLRKTVLPPRQQGPPETVS